MTETPKRPNWTATLSLTEEWVKVAIAEYVTRETGLPITPEVVKIKLKDVSDAYDDEVVFDGAEIVLRPGMFGPEGRPT